MGQNYGRLMPGRIFLLCAMVASCGRVWPTYADRTVDDSLLLGMRLDVVEWPDTLEAGSRADAEVELVLADGRPYRADFVDWRVDSVRILALSPTERKERKRLIAVSEGTARIDLTAWVYKIHGNERRWFKTEQSMKIVIQP